MHTVKVVLEELMLRMDRIDAQVIMAHVLGVNRAWIAANPMRILSESEDAKIDMLAAQREMGEPVAYLLNVREFYGRDFMVNRSVLIPRPETETLVEAALPRLAPRATCLDLGTGSGAIAVTLACQRPEASVVATDTSAEALGVARANAGRHHCEGRIEFLHGSWYAPLAGRHFDLVVSNPPYVAGKDPHLGQGDLRFEPVPALTDASPDGLDSIRAVVAGAPAHLVAGGWLLFEHGYDQAPAARGLLEAAGFTDIVSLPDLAGIPRVAGGKMAGESRRTP
ncbi:MAG TPA: peptide chain release factor N(5)-glutamine methyltransferase [Usitatibacter sp.]|jgi:release factor glutamine methyltransferase|nr:peptide chain release factor N(5)-glutamine methyltransferase [Usitatibacter sp.]